MFTLNGLSAKALSYLHQEEENLKILIKDPDEQLETYNDLLATEEKATYDPECDRFFDALPTDAARLILENGEKTNGALVWDGNVQIQGPAHESHVELMWRLIGEKNIKTILRIGKDNLKAGCCCPYTPSIGEPYIFKDHELYIYQKSEPNLTLLSKNLTRYNYQLKYKEKKSNIIIYGFEGWPDHQSADCDEILHLIEELQKVKGPILVHCRGGIGRSGALLICLKIYQLYMQASSSFEIDPAGLVQELRSFRRGAVERAVQFEMILSFIAYLQRERPKTVA